MLFNDRYWNPHYVPIDLEARKSKLRHRTHKKGQDSEKVPIYNKRHEQKGHYGSSGNSVPNSKSPKKRNPRKDEINGNSPRRNSNSPRRNQQYFSTIEE